MAKRVLEATDYIKAAKLEKDYGIPADWYLVWELHFVWFLYIPMAFYAYLWGKEIYDNRQSKKEERETRPWIGEY